MQALSKELTDTSNDLQGSPCLHTENEKNAGNAGTLIYGMSAARKDSHMGEGTGSVSRGASRSRKKSAARHNTLQRPHHVGNITNTPSGFWHLVEGNDGVEVPIEVAHKVRRLCRHRQLCGRPRARKQARLQQPAAVCLNVLIRGGKLISSLYIPVLTSPYLATRNEYC